MPTHTLPQRQSLVAQTVAFLHAQIPSLPIPGNHEYVKVGEGEAATSRLDGLRLDWPGGWLLVRASNTEPIVRIVAEAADNAAVEAAIARAAAALG